MFFGLISKTALTILLIFCQNVEENDTDQQEKKLGQKISYFSRYGLSKLGKISPFVMTSACLIQPSFCFLEMISLLFYPTPTSNYLGTLHAFQINIKWIKIKTKNKKTYPLTSTYIHTPIHTYIHTPTCIHTHTHTHPPTHTLTHTHTHTHTQVVELGAGIFGQSCLPSA